MSANKTKAARKATSPRIVNARRTALAGVRRAAFQSGTSRNAVIAATFAALGARPVLALYNAGKLELQIGFMAAALARKGDNREPEKLMEHCRDRLENYQGFGGTAKLRSNMKGRRTKAEEEAYGSARVLVSGIMKEAGVRIPETRGGDTSATRKPRPAAKATAKKAANDSKPIVRTFKDREAFVNYALIQAKALQATLNRSAAVVPAPLATAVNAFVSAAIAAAKPE
jgi:hypothetical protein